MTDKGKSDVRHSRDNIRHARDKMRHASDKIRHAGVGRYPCLRIVPTRKWIAACAAMTGCVAFQ